LFGSPGSLLGHGSPLLELLLAVEDDDEEEEDDAEADALAELVELVVDAGSPPAPVT
jgi:hypothetical protein